jgi:hypothetical protein
MDKTVMNDVDGRSGGQAPGTGVVGMKVMAGGTRGRGRAESTPISATGWASRGGDDLAALKWVLRKPFIGDHDSLSMTDMDQLDANVKRAMSEPFSGSRTISCWRRIWNEIRPASIAVCAGSAPGIAGEGAAGSRICCALLTYAEGYGQFALATRAVPGAACACGRGALRGLRGVYG